MKKKVLIILVACLIVISIATIILNLINDGYSISGSFWQDTIEKALMKQADLTNETLEQLTPKTILNTVYIDDIVDMTFVSKRDTLVTVSFVTNKKGQYSVHGYTEELCLDSPAMFLMNGDPKQFDIDADESILFPCNQYNSTVYGWCYSGYTFTVNGKEPTKETFVFECQGKIWSLDYWQIDNIPKDSEIYIEYID